MKMRAYTGLAAALSMWLLASGCKGTGTTTSDPGTDSDMGGGDLAFPTTPGDGHVLDAVYAELLAKSSSLRGRTWDLSSDNLLAGTWLLQSPPTSHWAARWSSAR